MVTEQCVPRTYHVVVRFWQVKQLDRGRGVIRSGIDPGTAHPVEQFIEPF